MTSPDRSTDGGRTNSGRSWTWGSAEIAELRRRNANAVAMDVLYLLTTAFFGHLALHGFWPAVIAAAPLGALLYFGWESSRPFFATQILSIALAAGATIAGFVPV